MTLTRETIDMAILAAPVVVTLLAGLAILLLLLRRWRGSCFVLLVALAINWYTEQIPLHIPSAVPAVKPEGTIRVLEYNICGKVEYVPKHQQPFLDFFKQVDADILFLPENSFGTTFKLEEMLKEMYPYSLHDFPEFEASQKTYPDQTLYSRYPLSNYQRYGIDTAALRMRHPYLDRQDIAKQGSDIMAFEVDAEIQGRTVTLLHIHLRTNGYDGAKEDATGKRSYVSNVYEALTFGYAFRGDEAEVIADSLRNCPNPLLICGDFNDISGSRSLRIIQDCRAENVHAEHRDRLQNAWWQGGCGYGFTFDDQHLLLRLDHILYSKEFQLQAVEVPMVDYSDHRPLVADFVISE